MAQLDLSPSHYIRPDSQDAWYPVLRDYLQDSSSMAADTAKEHLLAMLPHHNPQSEEAWYLVSWFVEVAHAIPADHPSMQKLIDLIAELHTDARWTSDVREDTYDQLHIAIREQLNTEDEKLKQYVDENRKIVSSISNFEMDLQWRNYQAFVARLRSRVWPNDNSVHVWSLWAMELLHEGGTARLDLTMRDAFPLGAAEWIRYHGAVLYDAALHNKDGFYRYTGPIWDEQASGLREQGVPEDKLAISRWSFWKDRFKAVSDGSRDDEFVFCNMARDKAGEAASIMEQIEKNHANATEGSTG